MFEFSNDSTGFSDADVQNILETLFNVEGIDPDTVSDIYVRDMGFGEEGDALRVEFDSEEGFREYYVIKEEKSEEVAIKFMLNDQYDFISTLNKDFLAYQIKEEAAREVIGQYLSESSEETLSGSFDDDQVAEEGADNSQNTELDSIIEAGVLKYLKEALGYEGETLARFLVDNGLVDPDSVAKEAIDVDGIGHFLSAYDGEEHKLADMSYNYYRWN